jgi:hypothetical protein
MLWCLGGAERLVMASATDFAEFARECIRLACETKDGQIREQPIQMARQWMQLVLEEEDKQNIAPYRNRPPEPASFGRPTLTREAAMAAFAKSWRRE